MAENTQDNLVALKRAVSAMRPRIDRLLSGGEKRELLKLISRGMIQDVNGLRAHLSRVEQMKSKQQKEQTCTLVGKVIDADNRRPVPHSKVRIQRTNYDEDTDGSGNFVWEACVKGRQYTIEASSRGYRAASTMLKATLDDEQFVVIKMAPLQRGGPKNKDKNKGGGTLITQKVIMLGQQRSLAKAFGETMLVPCLLFLIFAVCRQKG